MHHRDVDSLATIIAENIVCILRQKPAGWAPHSAVHQAVLTELMPELRAIMPTACGDALAAACNRFLDQLPILSERRPWVEAVDPIGEGVTMREGKRIDAFKEHSGSGFL